MGSVEMDCIKVNCVVTGQFHKRIIGKRPLLVIISPFVTFCMGSIAMDCVKVNCVVTGQFHKGIITGHFPIIP